MMESRIARGLMVLGAGIGVLSIVVAALDVRLNLPDWMIRVAMIKLAFVAAAGLLAAGALVGRHANARSLPEERRGSLPGERVESFGSPREKTRDEVEPGRGPDERGNA